jgi:hypothetical protein
MPTPPPVSSRLHTRLFDQYTQNYIDHGHQAGINWACDLITEGRMYHRPPNLQPMSKLIALGLDSEVRDRLAQAGLTILGDLTMRTRYEVGDAAGLNSVQLEYLDLVLRACDRSFAAHKQEQRPQRLGSGDQPLFGPPLGTKKSVHESVATARQQR